VTWLALSSGATREAAGATPTCSTSSQLRPAPSRRYRCVFEEPRKSKLDDQAARTGFDPRRGHSNAKDWEGIGHERRATMIRHTKHHASVLLFFCAFPRRVLVSFSRFRAMPQRVLLPRWRDRSWEMWRSCDGPSRCHPTPPIYGYSLKDGYNDPRPRERRVTHTDQVRPYLHARSSWSVDRCTHPSGYSHRSGALDDHRMVPSPGSSTFPGSIGATLGVEPSEALL